MSRVDRRPPVGMHTCLRVLTFAPCVREFCSRLRFSYFSPATCTSSASWRSRWPCSGRTAGSRSSLTGILYRLAVMTIPCQWWVATPAEDPPFVPRRQKLPLLQLEPRPPRGSCQKVLRKTGGERSQWSSFSRSTCHFISARKSRAHMIAASIIYRPGSDATKQS